jgi:hypothetical protein
MEQEDSMEKIFKLAAVAASVVFVAGMGCAKKTIVGKWSGTMGALPMTIELKEDKTFVESATVPTGETLEIIGNWSVDGDKLTLAATDVKTGGKSVLAMVPAAGRVHTPSFTLADSKLTLIDNGQTGTFSLAK